MAPFAPILLAWSLRNTQIRRIIYTTNTVEGFNRQLRKVTKAKAVFPNDTALMKLVFLAAQHITAKWTQPLHNWALVIQQLAIHFEGRLKIELNLEKKRASPPTHSSFKKATEKQ